MDPGVIQRQMLMQQFTMLKFFLSALSASKQLSRSTHYCWPVTQLLASNTAIPSVVDSVMNDFETNWW